MKLSKLFFFAILAIMISSCGDTELSNEEQLLGTWVLTEGTLSGTSTLVTPTIEVTITQEGRNNQSDHSLTFSDTGDYTEMGDIIFTVDYFLDGELLMTEELNTSGLSMQSGGTNDGRGVWSFSGDNLLIDGETVDIDFSSNQLIYNFEDMPLDIPLGETGIDGDFNIDMDIQLVYTKR